MAGLGLGFLKGAISNAGPILKGVGVGQGKPILESIKTGLDAMRTQVTNARPCAVDENDATTNWRADAEKDLIALKAAKGTDSFKPLFRSFVSNYHRENRSNDKCATEVTSEATKLNAESALVPAVPEVPAAPEVPMCQSAAWTHIATFFSFENKWYIIVFCLLILSFLLSVCSALVMLILLFKMMLKQLTGNTMEAMPYYKDIEYQAVKSASFKILRNAYPFGICIILQFVALLLTGMAVFFVMSKFEHTEKSVGQHQVIFSFLGLQGYMFIVSAILFFAFAKRKMRVYTRKINDFNKFITTNVTTNAKFLANLKAPPATKTVNLEEENAMATMSPTKQDLIKSIFTLNIYRYFINNYSLDNVHMLEATKLFSPLNKLLSKLFKKRKPNKSYSDMILRDNAYVNDDTQHIMYKIVHSKIVPDEVKQMMESNKTEITEAVNALMTTLNAKGGCFQSPAALRIMRMLAMMLVLFTVILPAGVLYYFLRKRPCP